MTREQLIARLVDLPGEILIAETRLTTTSAELRIAREALERKEAEEIQVVEGRNEQIREAKVLQKTLGLRQKVEETTVRRDVDLAAFNALTNEFRALRTVAGLLEAGMGMQGGER